MSKLDDIEKQMKIQYNQIENEKNQYSNKYYALKKEEEVLNHNITFFENYLQKLNELEKEQNQEIQEYSKKNLKIDNNVQNLDRINTNLKEKQNNNIINIFNSENNIT